MLEPYDATYRHWHDGKWKQILLECLHICGTNKCVSYLQLQVSDEAVAQLANMGFTTKESRRALRMSGQDVQRAVEFLMEERRKKSEKLEEDRRQRRERKYVGPIKASNSMLDDCP